MPPCPVSERGHARGAGEVAELRTGLAEGAQPDQDVDGPRAGTAPFRTMGAKPLDGRVRGTRGGRHLQAQRVTRRRELGHRCADLGVMEHPVRVRDELLPVKSAEASEAASP